MTTQSPPTETPAPTPALTSSRDWLRRGLILAVVLVAIGLFVLAGRSAQTDKVSLDVSGEIVQTRTPTDGEVAFRQSPVSLDLAPGWALASLSINGTDVPQREWKVTAALNLYAYLPDKGKTVEKLIQGGTNDVHAVVFRLADPTNTRDVDWSFTTN